MAGENIDCPVSTHRSKACVDIIRVMTIPDR